MYQVRDASMRTREDCARGGGDTVGIIESPEIPAFYYLILRPVVVAVVVARHSPTEINGSTYPSIIRLGSHTHTPPPDLYRRSRRKPPAAPPPARA